MKTGLSPRSAASKIVKIATKEDVPLGVIAMTRNGTWGLDWNSLPVMAHCHLTERRPTRIRFEAKNLESPWMYQSALKSCGRERLIVCGDVLPENSSQQCRTGLANDGTQLYLKIIPGWHFTRDGVKTPAALVQ